MTKLFETITNLPASVLVLEKRRYGVIVARRGRVIAVHLRPFPKLISIVEAQVIEPWRRARRTEDSCWIYYNQPRGHSRFLALKYLVSGPKTRIGTISAALRQLDGIAELKRVDALLCDVTNARITSRLLAREGWAPHAPSRWHRNYIKRFYGVYLIQPAAIDADRHNLAASAC